MAIAVAAAPDDEPRRLNTKAYHGVPVLEIHVDDPIPTPRAPIRYAVLVHPDLARYLLTFNHPDNRRVRELKVQVFAGDMKADRWYFTPESVIFSVDGMLQNGQNRLTAVQEAGVSVWMMVDFGWPTDIIVAIDRGTARTNGDTMRVNGVGNANVVAAAISKVSLYQRTVGTTRSWSGLSSTVSSAECIAIARSDPDGWARASAAAGKVYRALDKGGSMTLWTTLYWLVRDAHPDRVDAFFDELASGTGEPKSPTRKLADHFRRRGDADRLTGDRREAYEIAIRGFNAWLSDEHLAFPRFAGFTLTRIAGQ